ncbi:MAG TPA: NfeD family protein [Blastocatellia bacterium]|nr:NfeD family protein [Blastocatellia bacterium]
MSGLWYVWLILAAVFFIAELLTSGFVLLWFGVGALLAALMAYANIAGLPAQSIVFLAVSGFLVLASRTIFQKLLFRQTSETGLKTGVDALPGQVGTVVEPSAGQSKEGAVRVFGSTWKAFPSDGEPPLLEGEQVTVERIEGVSVFVRRVASEPSWRKGLAGTVAEETSKS